MTDTWQIGETPRFEAEIRASDTGALANPTTTTINIVDPAGVTKVDNTAMTNPSTGSFYHDYPIPSDGNIGTWEWNVIATGSGGRVTIIQSSFEVEAQV